MDVNDAVCIVTGASSGIGAATARLLSEKGARVVLGGVQRHAAPAATDVEKTHPRLQTQLAADQVVLRPLRVGQWRLRG